MEKYEIIKNKNSNRNICASNNGDGVSLSIEASPKYEGGENFLIDLDKEGMISLRNFINELLKKSFTVEIKSIETYKATIKADSLEDANQQLTKLIEDVDTPPTYHLENGKSIWKGVDDEIVVGEIIEKEDIDLITLG